MRSSVVVVVVVALAAFSAQAAEDNTAKAKKLYQAGSKAYAGERYKEALYAFTKANELDPHAIFWFNIGQCDRKLGKAQDAIDAYQKYLDGSPDAPNRAEVEKLITELKATTPPSTAPPTTTTTTTTPTDATTPADATAATTTAPATTEPEAEGPPWLIIGGVTAAASVVAVAGLAVAVSILSQPTLGKVDLRGGV